MRVTALEQVSHRGRGVSLEILRTCMEVSDPVQQAVTLLGRGLDQGLCRGPFSYSVIPIFEHKIANKIFLK